MSTELTPFNFAPLDRNVKRASREISRTNAVGQVRMNSVDSEAEVAGAKVDAYSMTTGQALVSVAKVAQTEQALVTQVPLASGRLAFIAERHALAVGEILDHLQSRLRRV
jgi:hypothetical protein